MRRSSGISRPRLKTVPASQSVEAPSFARLCFSLSDMPNAVRYADHVAEGTEPSDSQLITQMASILAIRGKGSVRMK